MPQNDMFKGHIDIYPQLTTRPWTPTHKALQNPHRISVNGGKPPTITHPIPWWE